MPLPHGGKVPMYKMKPLRGFLITAICILLLGVLFFYEGHRDPGDMAAHRTSNLALAVCIVLSGLLFIVATGRMWFKHLWHDRYK